MTFLLKEEYILSTNTRTNHNLSFTIIIHIGFNTCFAGFYCHQFYYNCNNNYNIMINNNEDQLLNGTIGRHSLSFFAHFPN